MRVYIAGPMTGLPDFNYPAFNAMAERLRTLGYEVCNPAENPVPPCKSWRGYMRMALKQMVDCDIVAMLPNWEDSKGARIECGLARDLELRIVNAGALSEPASGYSPAKRFALLTGDNYDHSSPGWEGFRGFHDTAEQALEAGRLFRSDWVHVVDLETGVHVEYD